MLSVGVPRETKDGEFRVAVTPALAGEICRLGADVSVERGAGARAGYADDVYAAQGARLVGREAVFEADLVVKVKEPNADEIGMLHSGQMLFTFVHLAGNPQIREPLRASGAAVLCYELVQDEDGRCPILAPMSHIAGRLSAQLGAHYLLATNGGRGVLLGSAPGTEPATTIVVGVGVVGEQAAHVAHGMGSRLLVVDRDEQHGRSVAERIGGDAESLSVSELPAALPTASLLVGAVHSVGEAAARVVSREMIASMEPGSVAVDVAIDEGGCFETSRPTSHETPTFVESGVVHYCVPNIPALVARSASVALCAATERYILALVRDGERAIVDEPGLREARAFAV